MLLLSSTVPSGFKYYVRQKVELIHEKGRYT